jgi:poly(hydroxyalkanoate) depolymerase family esterase
MTKNSLIFLLFLLHQFTDVTAQPADSLVQINHFGNNPGNLKMFMYVSKIKKDSGLKPLVIVLHGCGQTAEEVARLTGWNKLGHLNDFMVVYPQQKLLNNVSTCFNWFRNADINKGEGECESIYQMIHYMQQNYAIDSNRIFVTGLSAGAAMSVVMMATHPETIRSGAIFAGGAYKLATNAFGSAGVMAGTKKLTKEELIKNVVEQNPAYKGTYPKLIIYQGLNDYVVNHKNAGLLINQWTGITHIDPIPDKTEKPFMNIADIKRMEYWDSLGNTRITFYEIGNLGHRILVKPGNKKDEGGETGTYGADRGFHSTYQTAKDFGIIKQ